MKRKINKIEILNLTDADEIEDKYTEEAGKILSSKLDNDKLQELIYIIKQELKKH